MSANQKQCCVFYPSIVTEFEFLETSSYCKTCVCFRIAKMSMNRNKDKVVLTIKDDSPFSYLQEDLLIEIFIRVPISDWEHISSVRKQWAALFRGECLWQAALNRSYPHASNTQRWTGPIRQGSSKRLIIIAQNFYLKISTY